MKEGDQVSSTENTIFFSERSLVLLSYSFDLFYAHRSIRIVRLEEIIIFLAFRVANVGDVTGCFNVFAVPFVQLIGTDMAQGTDSLVSFHIRY